MKIDINLVKYEMKLLEILKANAPERDGVKYPGRRGSSPYPGNLRQNGITAQLDANTGFTVTVGNADAPYAVYTEKYSRKSGWMAKSDKEYLDFLTSNGWRKK